MIQNLLKIFIPSSNYQVVPVNVSSSQNLNTGESNSPNYKDNSLPLDVIRIKPLPNDVKNIQSSFMKKKKLIEEEIFLLSSDIKFSVPTEFSFFALLDIKPFSCYYFDESDYFVESKLVLFIKCIIKGSTDIEKFKPSDLIFSIRCLSQLLKDYKLVNEPDNNQTVYIQNCFLKLENAFIISDLLLSGLNLYNITGEVIFDDPLIEHLSELFENVYKLATTIHLRVQSSMNSVIIVMQIICKSCKLLLRFIDMMKYDSYNKSTKDLLARTGDIINICQIHGNIIALIKTLAGDSSPYYYNACIFHWESSQRIFEFLSSISVRSSIVSQSSDFSIKQINESKLINCVQLSSPLTYELSYEINKILQMKYGSHSNKDDLQLINYMIKSTLEYYSDDKESIADSDFDNEYDLLEKYQKPFYAQLSFRLRFLFQGVAYFIKSTLSGNYIETNPSSCVLPSFTNWITTLSESLVLMLSKARDNDCPKDLLFLAPYIAKYIFILVSETPKCSVAGSIFNELAKSLKEFSDSIVKRSKALNYEIVSESVPSPTPEGSVLSMSFRSTDNESKLIKNNLYKFDNVMSAPALLTESKPVDSKLSVESPPQKEPIFTEGDRVDGKCTLPNGSERWFPGVIEAKNYDGTYVIRYNDGDLDEHKPLIDLRETKNRRNRTNKGNNSKDTIESKIKQQTSSDASRAKRYGESESNETDLIENDEFSLKPEAKPLYPTKKELSSPSFALSPSPVQISKKQFSFSQQKSLSLSPTCSNSQEINTQQTSLNGTEIAQVDIDESSSDASDEDNIFTIPSVLNYQPKDQKEDSKYDIPKMELQGLDMSGFLPHTASSMSLSGALLNDFSQRNTSMATSTTQLNSHRSAIENILLNYSSINFEDKSVNGICNNKGVVPEIAIEKINSNGTRVQSWRGGDDSSRITDRNSSRLRGTKIDSRRSSNPKNRVASIDSYRSVEQKFDFEDKYLPVLLNTFNTICATLLKQCISNDGHNLDLSFCQVDKHSPRDLVGDLPMSRLNFSGIASETSDPTHQNILFCVREYLSACSTDKFLSGLSEFCINQSDTMLRLLKLNSAYMFENCLFNHISTGIKIGEGGFGTVFRVTCPQSCGNMKHYKNCYSCYKRNFFTKQSRCSTISWNQFNDSSDDSANRCRCMNSFQHLHASSFAVKRVPRERSAFDEPLIGDLFNEITSLEILSGNIGVCALEDYGVHESEYWLVMENGKMNLLDWRLNSEINPNRNKVDIEDPSNQVSSEFSSKSSIMDKIDLQPIEKLAILLSLFLDISIIIKMIHANHVIHFDIKCNNFILRDDPLKAISCMEVFHQASLPSGIVFLADFGESIHHADIRQENSLLSKCRGTLCVQSPEMLSLSRTESSKKKTIKKPFKPKSISGPTQSSKTDSSQENSQSVNRVPFSVPQKQSDIWSLGCLLVELLTGKSLFEDKSWAELFTSLCMKNSQPVALESLSAGIASFAPHTEVLDELKGLLRKILMQRPEDRLSIDEIILEVRAIQSGSLCKVYQELKTKFDQCFKREIDLLKNPTDDRSLEEFTHSSDHPSSQISNFSLPKVAMDESGPLSPISKELLQIQNNFDKLKSEESMLFLDSVHLCEKIFLHFGSLEKLMAQFQFMFVQNSEKVNSSTSPSPEHPIRSLDIIANVDKNIQDSGFSDAKLYINSLKLEKEVKKNGLLAIIHINPYSRAKYINSGSGLQKSSVQNRFEKSLKRFGCISEEQDNCRIFYIDMLYSQIDELVDDIHEIVSKVLEQYKLDPGLVIVSVDTSSLTEKTIAANKLPIDSSSPKPQASLNQYQPTSQKDNPNNSNWNMPPLGSEVLPMNNSDEFPFYDKQALTALTALSGFLCYTIDSFKGKSSIENHNVYSSPINSYFSDVVKVWRSFPWFESACCIDTFHYMVKKLRKNDEFN